MTVATLQLREPGPAQSNLIYHFCGRPPGTGTSPSLAPTIASMSPWDRLASILWDDQLRASVPFGATKPMVCFSESPVQHLQWLLTDRSFPPWALLFTRQWVYNFGGGPVWYPREQQFREMTTEQKNWAVRFDAHNSDWLHEREWRIPVMPGYSGLAVNPTDVVSIVVGDPDWRPLRQVLEPTGRMLGPDGLPNPAGLVPEFFPQARLPVLWDAVHRFWWDQVNRRFVLVHAPTVS